LTVQAPTKYELVINLKTAKADGFSFDDLVGARERGRPLPGSHSTLLGPGIGNRASNRHIEVSII
jgi:hypothetical protein